VWREDAQTIGIVQAEPGRGTRDFFFTRKAFRNFLLANDDLARTHSLLTSRIERLNIWHIAVAENERLLPP
jgi:hypothetical protein